MSSTRRRPFLAAAAAVGVAGCTSWIPALGDGEETDTSPADRRVPFPSKVGPDSWVRSTRSFANDLVSPSATPPQEEPDERWSAPEAGDVRSLAVVDGVVYAVGEDGVFAFDFEDGERLWDAEGERRIQPIDGRCYTFGDGAVVALDAETGEALWRHEFDGHADDLLEIDGTVYCASGSVLRGLHADTGDRRWTIEDENVPGERRGFGRLAAYSLDSALHWATGATYRQFRPNGGERPVEEEAISLEGVDQQVLPTRPAVVDGVIALGGQSVGLPRTPGTVRRLSERGTVWHRPFARAVRTPAVLQDRLLVSGSGGAGRRDDVGTVAALNPDTGDSLWETTVSVPVGPPAVANRTAYLGGADQISLDDDAGRLFAVGVDSGELRWTLETAGASGGHPLALVGDSIVLGTRQGVVVLE